jgi:hypothetical protein
MFHERIPKPASAQKRIKLYVPDRCRESKPRLGAIRGNLPLYGTLITARESRLGGEVR